MTTPAIPNFDAAAELAFALQLADIADAISLPRAMMLSAAARNAPPPTIEERAANVPRPKDTCCVSPCT